MAVIQVNESKVNFSWFTQSVLQFDRVYHWFEMSLLLDFAFTEFVLGNPFWGSY